MNPIFYEFVKSAIDVAGSAGHSAAYEEFGAFDPFEFDFGTQPARDLPCGKSAERG